MLEAASNQRRVLVIEDEALIQLIAADMLDEVGLGSEAAYSAAEALTKLKNDPQAFAAAIVDFGLPDRNGAELLAEMSALVPNLPLIVATGRDLGQTELLKKYRKLALLPKPYNQQQFNNALQSVGVTLKQVE